MKLLFFPSTYRSLGALIVVLTAGALVLGAGTAQADDGKVYPGSHCVRWTGGSPTYNFSLLGNASTTSVMRVDCPVVKDTIYGDIRDGVVRVIDQNFDDEVRCSLLSVFVNGGGGLSFWSTGVKETEGTSGLVKRLDFGSLSADSTSHYFYSCDIPPRYEGKTSWLINYRVDED